jgi:hypothetical protein
MNLQEIIIKILFFFAVFYGAIGITAFVSKKIREKDKEKKRDEP